MFSCLIDLPVGSLAHASSALLRACISMGSVSPSSNASKTATHLLIASARSFPLLHPLMEACSTNTDNACMVLALSWLWCLLFDIKLSKLLCANTAISGFFSSAGLPKSEPAIDFFSCLMAVLASFPCVESLKIQVVNHLLKSFHIVL